MQELKLISRLPKLSIIQAQGANPFYRSVREFGGTKLEAMTADTMATAIRIGNPASWKKALRVLQATGGEVGAGDRTRDRRGQSRNRSRRHRLRARVGCDSGGPEKAAPARIREIRGDGGPDPDRTPVEGSRFHHQVSSGRLVRGNASGKPGRAVSASAARPGGSRRRSWAPSSPLSRPPRRKIRSSSARTRV